MCVTSCPYTCHCGFYGLIPAFCHFCGGIASLLNSLEGKLRFREMLRSGPHQLCRMSPALECLYLLTIAEDTLIPTEAKDREHALNKKLRTVSPQSLSLFQEPPFTLKPGTGNFFCTLPLDQKLWWPPSQGPSALGPAAAFCGLVRVFCLQAHPLSVGFILLMVLVMHTRQ